MLFTGGIVSLKASNSKWEYAQRRWQGILKRTYVPSQSRKSPRSSDCISPFKCRPPPLIWNIFCSFASFNRFIAVRLNKINTLQIISNYFQPPQRVCGVENTRKMAFWEIHVLWIYFHFQLMYLIIFHTKITVRQNIL